MSAVVLRRVGVLLHLLCGFQDQATVLLSWIRDWTGVRLCATVKKQILGISLSPTDDTELIVTPMIHGSTLEMHESSPTTLGSCEGHDTVDAVSGCSVSTTSTCLPFPLPLCLLLPLPVFL